MQDTSIRALLNALRRYAETDPVLLAVAMLVLLSAFTAVAVVASVVAAPAILCIGAAEGLQRTALARRWAAS